MARGWRTQSGLGAESIVPTSPEAATRGRSHYLCHASPVDIPGETASDAALHPASLDETREASVCDSDGRPVMSELMEVPRLSDLDGLPVEVVWSEEPGADGTPVRIMVEQGQPADPNFSGTPDPLHTVDHLHVDVRANGMTGKWGS